MKFLKQTVLFYLGGTAYMTLEFLWRGRSHGSMFLLGGLCFLGMGRLVKGFSRVPLAVKVIMGSIMVTALELLTGLLVNRQYAVWDYRSMPYNYKGHICLNYSLLWMPVTLMGMWLYGKADKYLTRD